MSNIKISASTHPAKDKILDYVKELQDNDINIDLLHVDIMDGKFVEDKTFDYNTLKEISNICTYPLDVHLMVEKPMELVEKYALAGANFITVHFESFKDKKELIKCLKKIKELKCLVGISIKPDTRISSIVEFLPLLDLILVMSVVPGKSGQKFMPESINRIASLKNIINQSGKNILIEVDGGINLETIKSVASLGVDMVVCGSALYNSEKKNNFIEYLKSLA